MRNVLIILISMFILTGCYSKKPNIIVEEKRIDVIVKPVEVHYTYVTTPTLDLSTEDSIDVSLEKLMRYVIKLQTVVYTYENRVDSLKQWSTDVDKIYKKDDK